MVVFFFGLIRGEEAGLFDGRWKHRVKESNVVIFKLPWKLAKDSSLELSKPNSKYARKLTLINKLICAPTDFIL